jgi:Ca-activated chloride channel family protein
MSDMARKANGTFYDATSPEKLPAIFQAELEGLMSIASQNVRLRLKPLDFCHQFASLGSLPHVLLPDKRWEFHIGDLVSDEERWAVFALDVLSLPIGADGRPVASLEGEPLIEVEVVWDELGETEVTSHTHQQIVRIQAVQKPEDVKLNAEVLPWVASQRAGKTVEDAMTDVNRNDLKAAKGKLSELKEALGRYGHNDKVVDGLKLIQRTLDSIECGDVGESFKKRSTGNAHFYMRGSTAEMHTQACEDAPSWAGKQIEEDATYQETVKRKKKGKRPDDTQPPTA